MSEASPADAWDARVERALARAPGPLQRVVAWLRAPARRWVRLGAGLLLMVGSLLAILPVFGLWMMPLGLALLAEDSVRLKGLLERGTRRCETLWAGLRSTRS